MALEYMYHQYAHSNAVVAVAGNISHDEVVSSLSQALADWSNEMPISWCPAEEAEGQPRLRLEYKKTEQAHLCLALHGLSILHPDRFALDLLSVLLGEGMSSRLFLELRERRGLAYDVQSYASHFLDSGAVVVYAGVKPENMERATKVIIAELNRLSDDIPEAELLKVKEMMKGRLLLRMEDTRNVAGWLGSQELLLNRIYTIDDIISIIDAISTEELKRVAQGLLHTNKPHLAVVGPIHSERGLRRLLDL
jgi:predicted Zn-dependent peptidase